MIHWDNTTSLVSFMKTVLSWKVPCLDKSDSLFCVNSSSCMFWRNNSSRLFYFKTRCWEVAQSVKCLAWGHEDLSSELQPPGHVECGSMCLQSQAEEVETGRSPRFAGQSSSRFSRKPVSKIRWQEIEGNTWHQPLASTSVSCHEAQAGPALAVLLPQPTEC